MTEQERREVWADWMARLSAVNEPIELDKHQMLAAVIAADEGQPLPAKLSEEAAALLAKLVAAAKAPPPEPQPAPPARESILASWSALKPERQAAILADLVADTAEQQPGRWAELAEDVVS